jgi:hypothetical protein
MDIFDELIAGWAQAMDEIDVLNNYQKDAIAVKYATEPCFELEDFMPDSFLPRNAFLDDIPSAVPYTYEEYGLGANGLPCFCRTVGSDGAPIFAGFYRYTHEMAEFVQYNLSIGVPRLFQRIVFADGRKLRFMHAVANGGGAAFSGKLREQAVVVAKSDERSIFLYVRHFEYQNGVIIRDVSNNRAAGIGEYGFTGYYSYDTQGSLIEIKDVFTNGHEQLRYCYWDENEGLEGLTERLVVEMAGAIVTALLEENIDTPLAVLELSYHYADSYLPILAPLSVKEKDKIVAKNDTEVWQDLFLNCNGLYRRRLKGIEKTFTQFMNQINLRGAHDKARGMLQKTATLLTVGRLGGRIPTDPEFFAYAIDHSVEGHDTEDFKAILLNCGMPEKQYENWRERGWVRE